MTADHRVVVTSRSFSTGAHRLTEELADEGITVVFGPADHHVSTLGPLLADAQAWIAGTAPVTDELLALAPHLQIVARYGVGVDSVDLAAAARRGIVVTNTPGANSGAVADHAVALLLAALRRVTAGDRRVRSGSWKVERAHELGGLTVGIVGFGRIGRGVARRLTGFGCRVLATDPYQNDADILAGGATPVTPTELAQLSDVVSLHAPGESRIVDAAWLEQARSGLVLINTARAALVDEIALAQALRSGQVHSYAADTVTGESAHGGSPLLAEDIADRVTITPHSAAQTVQAIDLMGEGAVEAVRSVFRGETPGNLVPTPS